MYYTYYIILCIILYYVLFHPDDDADAEMTAFACATEGCFDSDSDDGELLAAA